MKKLCIPLILCLFIWGCAPTERFPEEILRSLSEITFQTGEVTGTIHLTDTGCEFSFSSPEVLKKLRVFYDGDIFTAKYGQIETKVPRSFLGKILPIYDLISAYQTKNASWADENIRCITLDERDFLLYYDAECKRITGFEVKGADGTFRFDVLSYIEKDDDTESSGTNRDP